MAADVSPHRAHPVILVCPVELAAQVRSPMERAVHTVFLAPPNEIGRLDTGLNRGALFVVYGETREGAVILTQTVYPIASGRPIVALCKDTAPETQAAILDAGADDVLPVPFDSDLFAAKMRAHVRRTDGAHTESAPVEIAFDEPRRKVELNGRWVQLTPTEFSIFRYLAERPGNWITSNQIIAEVIGTHHAPRSALVRVHLHHIRRKLGESRGCLLAEHGRGYMFRP